MTKPATPQTVDAWYANGNRRGIGVAFGYGGYELLDLETADVATELREAAEGAGLGPLFTRVRKGYCESTSSGGFHIIWRCTDPNAVEGNKKLARADGHILIETRGVRGYGIVAPSPAACGKGDNGYVLKSGGPADVAEISPRERTALLELARSLDRSPPPPPRERLVRPEDGTRPGDAYNRAPEITWAGLLEPEGWAKVYTRSDGVDCWRRPGKRDQGISATTGYHDSDLLWVFSTNAAPFEAERSYDKFGVYAMLHHDGDHAAAAKELAEEGYGEDASDSSWVFIDLSDALSGERPAAPDILLRTDECGILYRGKTHIFYGEPESMKTWLALLACTERIKASEHVAYIDFEDDASEVVYRLRCLGVSDRQILQYFHYMRPDSALAAGERERVLSAVGSIEPALCVLDGVTEVMDLMGLDPDRNKDVAAWVRIPRSLAALGPAVVSIDHVPKDQTNRSGPIGGQHKKAGISGASYYLRTRKPFGVGLAGVADIICTKDRPGRVREVAGGGKHDYAGSLVMRSDRETQAITYEVDPNGYGASDATDDELSFRIPSEVLEKVSQAVEAAMPAGVSKAALEKQITGKGARYVRPAHEQLLREGYLKAAEKTGRGGGYPLLSVKPWRAGVDDVIKVRINGTDSE